MKLCETVSLLSTVDRKKPIHPDGLFPGIMTLARVGFERRLLAACRWHAATAVAFPQKRDPTRSASSSRTTQVRDDFFMLRMKKSSLTCSTAPRFKIVTALLGHDFVFAAGTGRDVHEKSPSGRMGFFLVLRCGWGKMERRFGGGAFTPMRLSGRGSRG